MGTIVVPYGTIQQAFTEDPDAFHAAVDRAATAAAKGSAEQRAQLIAEWHAAIASLESAHKDDAIQSRLVADWPSRPGAINRALNGNHEMYSGGAGYFAALTSVFHQSSSCVALQNTNWLLLGLDTSYVDFDIEGPQVDWINR